MQVQKLPAIAGFIWINAGVRLMFGHFGNMVKILVTYVFALFLFSFLASWLAALLAALGVSETTFKEVYLFVILVLSPAASIGFLQACRDTLSGEPVTPLHILRGFQVDRRALVSLLGFGLFHFAAIAVVIASLPGSLEEILKYLASGTPPPQDTQESLFGSLALVAYLAVTLIIWYAPMLAAWNNMRAAKAMFYSVAACWRNKAAFLLFGFGWMMIGFLVIGLAAILQSLLGDTAAAGALLTIVILLYMGTFWCSVYVTYASVFVIDTQSPPATT